MAFITNDVNSLPSEETFQDLVDGVLSDTGNLPVGNLTAPSTTTLIAMGAVNNACERVLQANGWDWRLRWVTLSLESLVFGYDLPSDFAWFNTQPVPFIGTAPRLSFLSYEDLIRHYPTLYFVPDGAVTENPTDATKDAAILVEKTESHSGKPSMWSISGDRLLAYPIPNSADYDDWDTERHYSMSYYCKYVRMTSGSDTPEIGQDSMNAVRFLALAYFKQATESVDFTADESRGEKMLAMSVARHRRVYPDEAYSKFRIKARPEGVW